MKPKQVKVALYALMVLALLLRLAAIVALHSWRNPMAMEHRSIALSLLQGDGFAFGDFGYYGPSSVQSPPYPLLLAGLFKIFGADSGGAYFAAMVINSVFGAIAVALTYWMGKTLGAKEMTALIAAGLCAVWPTQIYSATYAQAIAMIVAAQAAMIVLFYRGVRTGDVWTWAAFSAVAALAALTEPVLLPITVLSGALVLVWPTLKWRVRIRNAAVLGVVMAIIIGPWTVRNRMVHGKWVPIKSTFWVNMWKGANDYATGTDRLSLSAEQEKRLNAGLFALNDKAMRNSGEDTLRQYAMLTPAQLAQLSHRPEAAREEVFKQWVTSWIGEHPGRYASLSAMRLGKTIWIDWDNPKSHSAIYVLSRLMLLIGTAAGLVLAVWKGWSLFYPALLIGSCLLAYTLTLTAARFSIPFEPIQFCFSAQALTSGLEWMAQRRRAMRLVAVGG